LNAEVRYAGFPPVTKINEEKKKFYVCMFSPRALGTSYDGYVVQGRDRASDMIIGTNQLRETTRQKIPGPPR
jgi:hypothetical protein